jgi:hypothetical protein
LVVAAEVLVASEGTSSSAARRSWRMESMPALSCHSVGWSVPIFSTYDVVLLCSFRSHDDVPGEVAARGGQMAFSRTGESNDRKPSLAAETLPVAVVACRKRIV